MSIQQHDSELLGAYVLGALVEQEVLAVDEHVASCQKCRDELDGLRELESALGEVPPEAFLDGPPEDGDLMLQRTLRQARGERDGAERRRWSAMAAVAAVVAAAVLGGGVLIGQSSGDENVDALPAPTSTPVAGTKVASGTSAETGSTMAVRVTPAADWVRINAAVKGIPAGELCRLIVVTKDGSREVAGSWLTADEAKGADLDGSAAVPIDEIAEIRVENDKGTEYVNARI
ncbi:MULTISPECIES: anti-sigma factor family protein [Streptomyces]|uniref:Zf-HC2 domain-containing protein n=1 Tax=Streptomyces sp. NBC_00093 TaxID=2975649 RepID=A0AAU1ZWK9_9ACTN